MRDLVIARNVVALLASPDPKSEQVSQLLLGEPVLLVEEQGEWRHTEGPDGYRGWAQRHDLTAGPVAPYDAQVIEPLAPVRRNPEDPDSLILYAAFTTRLRFGGAANEGWTRVELAGGESGWVESGSLAPIETHFSAANAAARAHRMLSTPYLWGGGSPFGFDCSGLTQRLYLSAGLPLPRDAWMQAASGLGRNLGSDEPAKVGDLVFFRPAGSSTDARVSHTGILIDSERMIHASGREGVTIQRMDDPDIRARYDRSAIRRYGEERSVRRAVL